MKYEELIGQCANQIGLFGPEVEIVLILSGRRSKRNTKRLISKDRKSPLGEIVSDNIGFDGFAVIFKAKEVMEYLMREAA